MSKMIKSKIVYAVIVGKGSEIIMIKNGNQQMKQSENDHREVNPPFEIEVI